MAKILRSLIGAAAMGCLFGGPAAAATECEDYFASMGRTLVADAQATTRQMEDLDEFLDCPTGLMFQFVFDVAADRNATPVAAASDLIGTWVSDDILGVVTGIFIPVYEVLEIAPGETADEVVILQKLVRANDATEWFTAGGAPDGVDVVAAGRIATYGEHRAVLTGPGQLKPRRVRYFDFPIESDRSVGLAMKSRMMSFERTDAIAVRGDGERLVFELFERLADGKRAMTFRRRRPESPENALLMALVGEISMSKFHCFLEAMERPTPAFQAALGDFPADDFFAALREAFRLYGEYNAMIAKMRGDLSAEERSALGDRIIATTTAASAMFKEGPLTVLQREARSEAPFGCVNPF